MELILDPKKQYTYIDYLTWWDDKQRELVDGFIKVFSPATSYIHQQIAANFVFELTSFVKRRRCNCKVLFAPFDVRFPKEGETSDNKIDTVVQPDICVICDPEKIDRRGCIGAPDMIVEIQSPATASYDLRTKFDLYEREGVREYWVAYREEGVEVFILQPDGKYGESRYYQKYEIIPVRVLPGCEIRLNDIYK